MNKAVVIGATLLLSACAEQARTPSNDELGIARYSVEESPEVTKVIGLDSAGDTVATIEIVHGQFTMSAYFADAAEDQLVVGRKLDIKVADQGLKWETMGFDPVLHMPSPPKDQFLVRQLIRDPFVQPLLTRWGIGFDLLNGESAYLLPEPPPDDGDPGPAYTNAGTIYGTGMTRCDNALTCGTFYRGTTLMTINTCGGSSTRTYSAVRVQPSATEYKLAQCCPPSSVSGQTTDWIGVKACSTTSTSNSCGTSNGACAACPSYPTKTASCYIFGGVQPAGDSRCALTAGNGLVYCYGAL